jgi:glutathione S-transferase
MQPTLITIPFSHYCEKVRWAFDRAGVSYREVGHLPMLSRLGTLRRGRWSTVPLLATDEETVVDSTAILTWLNARDCDFEPYPEAHADVVRQWEERFDRGLGPHTRRLVYAWVIDDNSLLRGLIDDSDVPHVEKKLGGVGLPIVRAMLRRALRITPEGAVRSRGWIEEIFSEVGAAIADGRRFLVGDAFTAADLTFASLAAPVLLPAEYGAPLPRLDALPPEGRSEVERLRSLPAGRFALRLFAEERKALPSRG